jgi:hypothetical protein
MSGFPEDFDHLVNEARAEQARVEAERRAVAAAAEARRQEIQQLPQLAKQLAAKAVAAHVEPSRSVRLPGRKTAWWRKRDPAKVFSGWEVYRWTPSPSGSDVPSHISSVFSNTHGVLLTVEGLLVAFRHTGPIFIVERTFWASALSVITGTEVENKNGRPTLMLFGADVEAMEIKKGLADFAARFLPL